MEQADMTKSVDVKIQAIDKTMLISDIVKAHPDIIFDLVQRGMHCIGCGASAFETLEEGLFMHGMGPEEIDQTVKELNEIIQKNSKGTI